MNHSVEWLEHTHTQHGSAWKHYGTIAQITQLDGEPHALIVRTADASTEYQPIKDVIEGDTIRLGKQIGKDKRRDGARLPRDAARGKTPHEAGDAKASMS